MGGGVGSVRGAKMGERLVVAATLEVMRELRVDRGRQFFLQGGDFLGSGAQFFEMCGGIARVERTIRDDGKAFAKRIGECGKSGSGGHARERA